MKLYGNTTLPLHPGERHAIDKVLADVPDGTSVSLTRRDPGETGPVLVHVGDKTYEIYKIEESE